MRTTIHKLIRRLDAAASLPEPIYEFGAREVPGQQGRSVRFFFVGREYVGCDLEAGPGVDRVLDLEQLELPDDSVGTAIVLDTVEHVEHVWRIGPELHRVLKPHGVAIVTSVMYFPVHEHPADYWRFTPDGFRVLAEPFECVCVEWAGIRDFPHTVVLVAVKGRADEKRMERVREALRVWKRRDSHGFKEILTIVLPPAILVPAYRWFTKLAAWCSRRGR